MWYRFERVWRDGSVAVEFDPIDPRRLRRIGPCVERPHGATCIAGQKCPRSTARYGATSTAPRLPTTPIRVSLVPRAVRGLLLATPVLLGACRHASPAPLPSSSTDPPPPLFEPAPRYTSTFDAVNTGCRDFPIAAYDGTAVLGIGPDHRVTFELVLIPKDVLGISDLVVRSTSAPPSPPPPSPMTCRWAGTGAPAPGRWSASLERAGEEADSTVCGEDPAPLALDCSPTVLPVDDANGMARDTALLRCTVVSPAPVVLWVLGSPEILLSDRALHLQLEATSFGIPRRVLSLASPSPAASQQ